MIIKFVANSVDTELTVPPPSPAKNYVPKWYSEKKMFDGGFPIIEDGEAKNLTVKACVPFADAMTAGYIQETWCDISITVDENHIDYQASMGPTIMVNGGTPQTPVPSGHYPIDFAWVRHWQPVLPRGYSALICQPLNRTDLPFTVTSAIVDFDTFHHRSAGNIPFFLREGFSGIIPAGTPMYQIIPIKRDSWESETIPYDELQWKKWYGEAHRKFFSVYRNFFHQKKSYK